MIPQRIQAANKTLKLCRVLRGRKGIAPAENIPLRRHPLPIVERLEYRSLPDLLWTEGLQDRMQLRILHLYLT